MKYSDLPEPVRAFIGQNPEDVEMVKAMMVKGVPLPDIFRAMGDIHKAREEQNGRADTSH